MFVSFISLKLFDIIIDGSIGDGTEIGKCPSGHSTYKCLSTGGCNVCGLISGVAEGCDITTTSPVCDADSTTSGIQDSASGKVAKCVACKKSGNLISYFVPEFQEFHSMIATNGEFTTLFLRWNFCWRRNDTRKMSKLK